MPRHSQCAVSGHYRPVSKTPFKLRFAGGPIVARSNMLTGEGHVSILVPTLNHAHTWASPRDNALA